MPYRLLAFFLLLHFSGHAQSVLIKPDKHRAAKQLKAFVINRVHYFSTDGRFTGPDNMKPYRPLELQALGHALLASGDSKALVQANYYFSGAKDIEWYRANFILLKYRTSLLKKAGKTSAGF